MRTRFPIAVKLMMGFALAALLPMALLSIFAFRSLEASHEKREQERRKQSLIAVRKEVEIFIEELKKQVKSISSNDDVKLNLVRQAEDQQFFQLDFIYRTEFLMAASRFDFLDMIDANGKIRARGQDTNDYNVQSGEKELLNALKTPGSTLVRITRRDVKDVGVVPAIEVIAPVTDPEGRQIGMVEGGYYINKTFFKRLGLPSGGGSVILIDKDGNALGSNLTIEQSDIEGQFFEYLSGRSLDNLVFPLKDEKPDWKKSEFRGNVLAAISIADLFDASSPVYIVVAFPQGEFNQFLKEITRSLILYSLLAAALALVVGLILASNISAPIRRLSSHALEFAQTGVFKPFKIRSGDEVEALVKSFKQMAEELETNTRRLIQAEKIAAWRDVARKLAHEIKNPLFPIRLNVETLQRYHGKDPKAFEESFNEATNTIIEEVDHLKRLADEFGSFARMPKPLLAPGDLNKVMQRVMEMFPSNELVTYEFSSDDEIPDVMFDEGQLRMALVNLIKNGSESFNGKAGTVAVATHNLPEEGKVLIEISDTGPGISESELQKIFTPYYTTKESGTGLGLAIVENIVNDHGGKIWAQSQPGEGTTFFITLNSV